MKYILLFISLVKAASAQPADKSTALPDSAIQLVLTAEPVNPYYTGPMPSVEKRVIYAADGISEREKAEVITEMKLSAQPAGSGEKKPVVEKKSIPEEGKIPANTEEIHKLAIPPEGSK